MNLARLALQYGSNVPIRVSLALASTFWAIGLVLLSMTHEQQVYRLMSGAHPLLWAGVFAINALLLWWRIIDRRSRPHSGRAINALTCSLWLIVTVATMVDAGFLAAAGDLTLLVMAMWATFRTDLTTGDRETV